MRRSYLIGFIALTLFGGVQGKAQKSTPNKTETPPAPSTTPLPTTIPFSFWRGVPAVEAHLQGEAGEEFFVLSTGFNGFTIHPEVLTKHHLTPQAEKTRVVLLDHSLEANTTLLKSLNIGTAHLDSVTANVVDVNTQISHKLATKQQAPSGWMGTPVLSKFQVTLDSSNRTVTLEDPKSPLPKTPETYILPFTLKEGRILLKVEVEGAKPFQAILDTGTVGTLIPTTVGSTLRTTGQKLLPIRNATGKLGQVIQNRAPKLRVGEIEMQSVGVLYISPDSPPEFDRNIAILGMNFLRYFKVTINYTKLRLALTPITATPIPQEP